MITAINRWANELRKRSPSQKTDSLFVFTDFSYIYLVTHMTCFTRGRCGRTAAECSFAQFSRKFFAYGVHDVDHFIERNQLCDSGKRHFCGNEGICNTGGIAVLAWIFDKTADRVTDQSEHIHENSRSRIGALFWSATQQFRSLPGSRRQRLRLWHFSLQDNRSHRH